MHIQNNDITLVTSQT